MARLVLANTATAAYRRVYFHCVDATDGITPETGEAGGQPQISSDGASWTNTGIGTLTAIGNGRYYADLTQTAVQTAGTVIETRYKSANTAESVGDTIQVVAFDPNSATSLGLTYLDAAVTSRLAPTVSGRTLDVSAAGNAGIDWSNIEAPTTTVALSGTTILLGAAGLDAVVVESGVNARQALSAIGSATAGKASGAGTGTMVYTGIGNSTTRISASVSSGNRTAITYSLPA